MNSEADIRAHIVADARLQDEITRALHDFADSLPGVADLRVVRILTRTLEPSWTEHVGFQERVVFPIVANLNDRKNDIDELIGRLKTDHAMLAEHHSEVAARLHDILDGDRLNVGTLGHVLRRAGALRIRHFDDEAVLATCLSCPFTADDKALLSSWIASRPNPAFPLGVLGWRRMRSGRH